MKLQSQNFTRPKKQTNQKSNKQLPQNQKKEKKLEKYTFRSFKGKFSHQGFVFFMQQEFDPHILQQSLFCLFKHQYERQFRQPHIVFIENQEFLKFKDIKPNKLYFIFIAECSEIDKLEGFEIDERFQLEDAHKIPDFYIIYEQLYDQLILGPDLLHIHQNVEQIISQLDNEMKESNVMYEQFRNSCFRRREVLAEQIQKVKEKAQQLREFSNFINWSYQKYSDLQNQMTLILKENEIQFLDPVFGNDIDQKKQIEYLNQNKSRRIFDQTQEPQKPSNLLNLDQTIQSEDN